MDLALAKRVRFSNNGACNPVVTAKILGATVQFSSQSVNKCDLKEPKIDRLVSSAISLPINQHILLIGNW